MSKKVAPYGTWVSPITSDMLSQQSIVIADTRVDPITSTIYHSRLDRRNKAEMSSYVRKGVNAQSTVQEYGGSCSVITNGTLVFSNHVVDKDGKDTDNSLYMVATAKDPIRVTPDDPLWRYADFSVHPQHRNLIVSVLEDHTESVLTSLVTINIETKSKSTLLQGAYPAFYSSPLISPDGKFISFVQWFLPDMPWEGGETVLAPIALDGDFLRFTGGSKVIAGKRGASCSQQPEWISNDEIILLSDISGYLNPYIYTLSTGILSPVSKCPIKEDFGEPTWFFGQSVFAILDSSHGLFSSIKDNNSTLYLVDLKGGSFTNLNTPYNEISRIRRVSGDSIVFKGKKPDEADAVVQFTLSTRSYKVLKSTSDIVHNLPKGIISLPQPQDAPSSEGTIYCTYYQPQNPDYEQNKHEKPPCVVNIHGGPTARQPQGLSLVTQFFTSRGFSWLDVNYGGSSGFGSKYIERLRGEWGIVDEKDSIKCVEYVGSKGFADEKRALIRGGSAGGFTVLTALTKDPDFFAAGSSFYGISDLRTLSAVTEKFESRYMDRLLGAMQQQDPKLYIERSPVCNVDQIKSPVLFLQGADDHIVPPKQSYGMYEAIIKKSGTAEYKEYPGEGHGGWTKSADIKDALDRELAWYKKVLKLK